MVMMMMMMITTTICCTVGCASTSPQMRLTSRTTLKNLNFAVQHVTPCLYVTVCFTNGGAHLPATRRHTTISDTNFAYYFLAKLHDCLSGRHASLCDSDVVTRVGRVELMGLGDGGDETSCLRSEENCVLRNGVIDMAHRVW
jgi:hypothetical protein